MIHKGDSFRQEKDRLHATIILERPIQGRREHIKLPDTRRATLSWLALLIMPAGTICLGRLAAPVASPAQPDFARRRPIPSKKHGRRVWPLFALGLSALRKIEASANPPQASAFLSHLLSPKLPLNSLKSLAR
jgi:hypothetical protein